MDNPMHRRNFLQRAAGVLAAAGMLPWVKAQTSSQTAEALPSFTGPGPNPYWNGVNPFVVYPQKLPLLRLTDRGIQLETPRQYFRTAFTPNEAFFVRYHLDLIPNSIDLFELAAQRRGQRGEAPYPFHARPADPL
ncbi:MAG: hypothetical protein RML14_03595 [Meiothermus sp.]|uniref:hypothetical protein n=1 Tax=Meiothermus sp. TaxID=1955249 RepID=UPI00298EF72F|nr:hypothetical protein [Meiothermus sp.]MDW8480971.1 hypothetical protein [Meiothermus sp.]